jgi:hypothetical protein
VSDKNNKGFKMKFANDIITEKLKKFLGKMLKLNLSSHGLAGRLNISTIKEILQNLSEKL